MLRILNTIFSHTRPLGPWFLQGRLQGVLPVVTMWPWHLKAGPLKSPWINKSKQTPPPLASITLKLKKKWRWAEKYNSLNALAAYVRNKGGSWILRMAYWSCHNFLLLHRWWEGASDQKVAGLPRSQLTTVTATTMLKSRLTGLITQCRCQRWARHQCSANWCFIWQRLTSLTAVTIEIGI